MHLLALLACTDGPTLNAGKPELKISPSYVDFGEVVVGNAVRLGLRVENAGYGDLRFEDVMLGEGTSADFAVAGFPEALGRGEEGVVDLVYTPDVEGQDFGALTVVTDDPERPELALTLEGMGTRPEIDLDPEILYFGLVAPGTSVSLTASVGAGGSGKLRVTGVGFAGDEGLAYAFTLPDDWEEPYLVSNGFSFPIVVTFTPPDEAEYSGELWIQTNDPEEPVAALRLLGNTADDPTENTPPVVQILDPDNGEYFLDDVNVSFSGYVFDADEAASNLTCAWYADGTRIDYADVDPTGVASGGGYLPVGEVPLVLRCYDSDGMMGEDSVRLTVWPHEEPLAYTISGGESVFDYFSIDDDIRILVNGVEVFADDNRHKDTLPPVEFEASRGDVIRIVASDINSCDLVLDALVLHWGTGESQGLNDAMCESACVDGACYDGGYSGPWPGIFLDEEYTIAIP